MDAGTWDQAYTEPGPVLAQRSVSSSAGNWLPAGMNCKFFLDF